MEESLVRLFDRAIYGLSHPEVFAYAVATALFYPALWVMFGALVLVIVEAGRLTAELLVRRGKRSVPGMEALAKSVRGDLAAGKGAEALATLKGLRHGRLTASFVDSLSGPEALTRVKLTKTLNDIEILAGKRLEKMRILVRVAPILGLMTTLIPISPALVALANGDVQTLSNKLVVAFSTTVLGLVIGGAAFLIAVVRDRLYTQDLSDIEYVLDLLELPHEAA